MNSSMIRYILGNVLKIEGFLLLLPCLVALFYQESEGFVYLGVALLCIILGFLLTLFKPKNSMIYLKEGCVTTALSWILLSLFGCIPFILTGEIPVFTDALFETISGFTTTGASILSDVEALSRCSTFWRCFTHWIGGMGVLVFLLAVVPLSGGSNINLLKAESPGPSVGKLVPKMRHTARILYLIYFGLTMIQIVFLLIGGMTLLEALATSFATAGTGGFGIYNSSIGGFSPYIMWVTTVFMILFGINFNAYYLILLKQFKKAFTLEEVRTYIGIILVAVGIIFVNIVNSFNSVFEALTHAFFQVASIITTTGFATTDFNAWPTICCVTLVLLMFVGACAGSTGGGIKVSRFVIAFKTMLKEFHSYLHPKAVKKVYFEKKPVEHEVVRSVNVFFMTYVFIFIISILLVSIEGKDITTSFTAVTATINNIGPGLEMVGPTQNFGHMSVLSKYVLMFDMLAGRLELFPLLLLFHPAIWKAFFLEKTRARKQKN